MITAFVLLVMVHNAEVGSVVLSGTAYETKALCDEAQSKAEASWDRAQKFRIENRVDGHKTLCVEVQLQSNDILVAPPVTETPDVPAVKHAAPGAVQSDIATSTKTD
jgi:hypothetical protein